MEELKAGGYVLYQCAEFKIKINPDCPPDIFYMFDADENQQLYVFPSLEKAREQFVFLRGE